MVRNVKTSLDLPVATVAEGRQVHKDAAGLMAKLLIPFGAARWCFRFGGVLWKRPAKRRGVQNRFNERPHQRQVELI